VLVIPYVLGEHPVQTGDVPVVQLAHWAILVQLPDGAVLTGHVPGVADVAAAAVVVLIAAAVVVVLIDPHCGGLLPETIAKPA
jgi:hypothetical protein